MSCFSFSQRVSVWMLLTATCHQVMYGGTNATSDIRALQQRTPDILVSCCAASSHLQLCGP